jgi:hypothetical protein
MSCPIDEPNGATKPIFMSLASGDGGLGTNSQAATDAMTITATTIIASIFFCKLTSSSFFLCYIDVNS